MAQEEKLAEKLAVANLSSKSENPTNVIPLTPLSSIPIKYGSLCNTVWGVFQYVKEQLTVGPYPKLIFLYLDQNGALLDLHAVSYKGSVIRREEALVMASKVSLRCREIICVLAKNDIQKERKSRDYELRGMYRELFGRLGLSFSMKDVKLVDLFVSGGSMLFSVNQGSWFSFLPSLENIDFESSESVTIEGTNIRPLAPIPKNDEESRMLRLFRSLPPMQKGIIRAAFDAVEGSQIKYKKIISTVADGRPLSDEQAKIWAWLRDKVISGEFYP